MRKYYLLLLSILLSISMLGQKYAVHFTDKNNSPYSINNPEEFLSQRSIERRIKFNIPIDETDLPVNPEYVNGLSEVGAVIGFTSKWLNVALISCNSSLVNTIQQLPYVESVVYISPGNYTKDEETRDPNFVSKHKDKLENENNFKPVDKNTSKNDYYGHGFEQINQINGIPVHNKGFRGKGILIGVIDAGFDNLNNIPAFDVLYEENRIVFEKDFVVKGGNIYSNTSNHGTNVLSCIATNLVGEFVGTAPEAAFALIRTENANEEYLIEPYNWAIGAEAADSLGCDLISTSLGYSTFDDESMDFEYYQSDGETLPCSKAAKLATEKGIFVTCSAGNSNFILYDWRWVSPPADVVSVATVGAVDAAGEIAFFSSIGPNGAGDPKPDICARGIDATVISTEGSISYADGTSFSCPITAGMIACLIQANPLIKPMDLLQIVNSTGDRYPNHSTTYGYGIPDYDEALEILLSLNPLQVESYTVNDNQGNNDGQINTNETVSLNLTFKNISDVNMSIMSDIVFSTDNQYVTLIDSVASLPDLNSNESVTINNALSFSVSQGIPVNEGILFKGSVQLSSGDCIIYFTADISGYEIILDSYVIDDSEGNDDGKIDPNENFIFIINILNNGNIPANNIVAELESSDNNIVINTNTDLVGNMEVNEIKSTLFDITSLSSFPTENINIPFTLKLTDGLGTETVIDFLYKESCDLIFSFTDDYGDGWNDAILKVEFSNGAPSQELTLESGAFAEFAIEVETGIEVSLTWISGAYDDECSFTVKDASGNIIYSSPSMLQSGLLYTFINNCIINSYEACSEVTNLTLNTSIANVNLSWNEPENSPLGYNIYRDLIFIGYTENTTFTDFGVPMGQHDYCIESVCENSVSMEVCKSIIISDIPSFPQYAVFLKDKNNSPYSIDNPSEYLSERAIARRQLLNIPITTDDLPVNPEYINQIANTSAIVNYASKWLNCVVVYANDSLIESINNLTFIDSIVYVCPEMSNNTSLNNKWDKINYSQIDNIDNKSVYGQGFGQINQINGIPVHDAGYKGDGIIITVLDAGFNNVNQLTGLQHLFDNNKIIYTSDLVEKYGDIYSPTGNSHGTSVLSCMASYLPNEFVGTAPEASYILIRTEDAFSEYLIEEFNWVKGAEIADSIGSEIINSSLSYSTFDDSSMDHVFSDMDGSTCPSSIGCKMATERGIYVSVSAGNSNGSHWSQIGTPADVEEAATIGAVDINNEIASFSSLGNNSNNYPKPDYCALGVNSTVLRPNNEIEEGSGTSFSSPISCGMVACLIQANNSLKPKELKQIINSTSSKYPDHYIDYGYGIPNFALVLDNILSVKETSVNSEIIIYPNPVKNIINVESNNKIKNISIYNVNGILVKTINCDDNKISIDVNNFKEGLYFIVVKDNKTISNDKFLKTN
jgi:serine protease AprX